MATFEDLNAWKSAKEMTKLVYMLCDTMKDRGFKDQLQRASMSIMNNIAEGYERETELDRKRFMVMAKGSCAEVRSMLHIGYELEYFNKEMYDDLLEKNQNIGRLLYGLIKSMSGI